MRLLEVGGEETMQRVRQALDHRLNCIGPGPQPELNEHEESIFIGMVFDDPGFPRTKHSIEMERAIREANWAMQEA